MTEKKDVKKFKKEVVEKVIKAVDSEMIDAIKELTTAVAENTKIVKAMKAVHDKWVRAGKF